MDLCHVRCDRVGGRTVLHLEDIQAVKRFILNFADQNSCGSQFQRFLSQLQILFQQLSTTVSTLPSKSTTQPIPCRQFNSSTTALLDFWHPCWGISQQVNYLIIIDESMNCDKGANVIISMLLHFLENFGFGEQHLELTADVFVPVCDLVNYLK